MMPDRGSESLALKPVHVVMVFLIVATCFAVCFFTSPASDVTPDGAARWSEDSVLKSLCDALAFNFTIPTPQGYEIKALVAIIAGVVALMIAVIGRAADSAASDLDLEDRVPRSQVRVWRRQIDPALAAQWMLVGFVLLSFLSTLWAAMPELAVCGSILLSAYVAWALGIRLGLNAAAAAIVGAGMVAALAAAALVAVWYHYERNRTMRVGYPIGNPLFLGASMIPAIGVCAGWVISGWIDGRRGRGRGWARMAAAGVALVPICWAVRLADPRSTYVGLAAGAAAMGFLAVRGYRGKVMVGLVCTVAGLVGYLTLLGPAIAGRPQTIRTRLYAWSYAQDLVVQAPVVGHGQGAFALLGDALTQRDVLDDPRALDALLLHAHNEWLETAADLGSLGVVLLFSCYALTLLAGVRALRAIGHVGHRWLLIGLLGALFGLLVEESMDVALRVAGLPTFFFATLGLCWVLIDSAGPQQPAIQPSHRAWRWAAVVAAVGIGITGSAAALWDFQGARAQYEFRGKLQQGLWEEAIDDIGLARRFRLNPSRRLAAIYEDTRCRAHIAQGMLEEYLQVKDGAQREGRVLDPADLARRQQRILEMAASSITTADEILSHTAGYFGLHHLVAACYLIYHNLALEAGRPDLADSYRGAAAQALSRELLRQPYNADLVWKYLEVNPQVPIAEQLSRILAPMRFHEVDQRLIDYVQNLAQLPEFADVFAEALRGAMEAPVSANPPYAAQILRMAAWLEAGRGRFDQARAYAELARQRAEPFRERFPIAFAIAHRELAHYGFLVDPEDVQAAIDLTRRGRDVLPNSHEAAPSRARFDDRLALLYVALGDEVAATAFIPNHAELKPAALSAQIASRYYGLCQLLSTLPQERLPSYYGRALDRLDALADEGFVPPQVRPTVDSLQAVQAQRRADWAQAVRHWTRAVEHGGDPQQVLDRLRQSTPPPQAKGPVQALIMRLEAMRCGPPEAPAP